MDKEFAPGYEKNDKGWWLFPKDVARRRRLFIPESMKHNAKANVFMVEELIRYCSEPGDVVMDIFGGTGTILVGLPMRRSVYAIEMNPDFAEVVGDNGAKIYSEIDHSTPYIVNDTPCQIALPSIKPDTIQAIITSPPYAGAFAAGSGVFRNASTKEQAYQEQMQQYTDDSLRRGNMTSYNLATMSNFMFNKEMAKIYAMCYRVIKPGGYFALIIKDRIKKGVREELGLANLSLLVQAGFKVDRWERWLPPGTRFAQQARVKGMAWVDEEHLIIVKKE